MKKNGFTLIELLAVLIILAVIMLITVVSVNSVLNSTKSSLSETQIKRIEEAAKTYYLKEGMTNNATCISVSKLIKNGYIDGSEVKNPEDNLEMTGSVIISYASNQYSYEYQEEDCICNLADNSAGTGMNVGAKYNCKVNLNKEPYTFYVLSTNKDASGNVESLNLIMYANIDAYGDPVDSSDDVEDKGIIGWLAKGDNIKGPETAMNYLNTATSSWREKLRLNETYTDEGGNFGTITLNEKARLPKLSEVSDYKSDGTNLYLYDYMAGINGSVSTNKVSGVRGYWILSSVENTTRRAWRVGCTGDVASKGITGKTTYYGVRPVITVSIEDIEI